jgi:hypothetical protein
MTKNCGPAGPGAVERSPEEPVHGVQCWPRPFEHGDLQSEGEDFEGGLASTAKEDADHGEDGEEEFGHELTFLT